MGRASTERDETLSVMNEAVMTDVFTNDELKKMLVEAMLHMTKYQMENMVSANTRFEDVLDVDVELN